MTFQIRQCKSKVVLKAQNAKQHFVMTYFKQYFIYFIENQQKYTKQFTQNCRRGAHAGSLNSVKIQAASFKWFYTCFKSENLTNKNDESIVLNWWFWLCGKYK